MTRDDITIVSIAAWGSQVVIANIIHPGGLNAEVAGTEGAIPPHQPVKVFTIWWRRIS